MQSPTRELTVAIAANDQVTLRRVRAAMATEGATVIAESSSLEDLVSTCAVQSPHAIVTSWTASGDRGRADLAHAREHLPDARIVLLVPSPDTRGIRRALKTGADGVVVETDVEGALGATVRVVCAGQVAVPPTLRGQIDRQVLSPREKQVLSMVVMGFQNCEIAGRLFLAESTVKSHLSSAFAKLGVRSRSEATAVILDPDEGLGAGILTIPTDDGAARAGVR